MKWSSGIPKKPGIYWFSTGLNPDICKPLVLQMYEDKIGYVNGHSVTMPLSSVYSEKFCLKAIYAPIENPKEWFALSAAKKLKDSSSITAWVKNKNSLGFGEFRYNPYDEFNAHFCLWEKHPDSGAGYGIILRNDYKFSLVEIPVLK